MLQSPLYLTTPISNGIVAHTTEHELLSREVEGPALRSLGNLVRRKQHLPAKVPIPAVIWKMREECTHLRVLPSHSANG
jgi:hypothetical protein